MWLIYVCMVCSITFSIAEPPRAKVLGENDSDLLSKNSPRKKIKVRAAGKLVDEVDDYSDFASETVQNGGANFDLKAVTFKPIPQVYQIPKVADEGPMNMANGKIPLLSTGQSNGNLPILREQRKGTYWMHYPYDRLPKAYKIRPAYQYIYPPQYQNTVYAYSGTPPYTDPLNIYGRNYKSPCAPFFGYNYGCGNPLPYDQQPSSCNGGGCGGGCGSGGCGGGCGDGGCGSDDGYEEDSSETSDEDDESGGKSGETHINKKDPLNDLDLEDLEKLDKNDSTSSEKSSESKSRRQ